MFVNTWAGAAVSLSSPGTSCQNAVFPLNARDPWADLVGFLFFYHDAYLHLIYHLVSESHCWPTSSRPLPQNKDQESKIHQTQSPHKLNLSMLKPSLLLTLFMTPSLKYLSSPVAVRPPIYHLSDPRTSLNPSLLLSLPLRRLGVGMDGAAPRGERTLGDRDCWV